MTTSTKTCLHCKTEKSVLEFHKHKAAKDGLNSWCKECSKASSKKWNAEFIKTYAGIILNRWRSINQRCVNGCYKTPSSPQFEAYTKKGIKINMTKDEFTTWMLSVEHIHNEIVSKGERSSIDRIDDDKGYEIDNLQMISLHENIEKRVGKSCKHLDTHIKALKQIGNRKAYLKHKNSDLTSEI